MVKMQGLKRGGSSSRFGAPFVIVRSRCCLFCGRAQDLERGGNTAVAVVQVPTKFASWLICFLRKLHICTSMHTAGGFLSLRGNTLQHLRSSDVVQQTLTPPSVAQQSFRFLFSSVNRYFPGPRPPYVRVSLRSIILLHSLLCERGRSHDAVL